MSDESKKLNIPAHVSEFCCGSCHGNNWDLYIGENEKKEKLLILRCGDPNCVEEVKRELEVEEEDGYFQLAWKAFDITGQLEDDDTIFIPGLDTEQDEPTNVN